MYYVPTIGTYFLNAKKFGDLSSIGRDMIRKGRVAFDEAVVKENMLPIEVITIMLLVIEPLIDHLMVLS